MNYKYLTEHSVHMQAEHMFLLQEDDLELTENLNKISNYPCHIYSICSRPKIKIDKDSIEINDEFIKGRLMFQIEDSHENIDFECQNNSNPEYKTKKIETKYPYTSVDFLMENGEPFIAGKLGYLYHKIINSYHPNFDLKVLYVGQAFGDEGSRIAPDRLSSHSTLQKIYREAINENPDKDIWLILWTFIPKLISFTHSTLPVNDKTLLENETHYNRILERSISLKHRVNFTEAALIRYFQPQYNDKFKEHFPESSHTSYSECFDLDINSVSFELETSSLVTRLYSDNVSPNVIHIGTFALPTKEDRKALFDFFAPQEE